MEDRLRAIEERSLFVEHQVEQLDEAVRELGASVESMRRELQRWRRLIEGRLDAIEAGDPEDGDADAS